MTIIIHENKMTYKTMKYVYFLEWYSIFDIFREPNMLLLSLLVGNM